MSRPLARAIPFVPAAILLVGALGLLHAHAQQPVKLGKPLEALMPPVPGYGAEQGYTTKTGKVGKEEARIAGMTDYVLREYRRDSLYAFSTFVSYYETQSEGKTIHSPRNCLPGAGWEILVAGRHTVPANGRAHEINRHLLKNGANTAVVLYWYQGRGRVVANEYVVKWNLLRDAAIRGHTEEALVRIVIPVYGDAGTPEKPTARLTAAYALGDTIARNLVAEVSRVIDGAASPTRVAHR
jgi:EpsI family protein